MAIPTRDPVSTRRQQQDEAAKWVIVAGLVFVALVALLVVRQITNPLVGLATQQTCSRHGDLLQRPVTGYEQARTFTVLNRTDGTCFFGPITIEEDENGEPLEESPAAGLDPAEPIAGAGDTSETLTISLSEIEATGLYQATRLMAIVLQLGAASIAVRLLADPLLDRFVR